MIHYLLFGHAFLLNIDWLLPIAIIPIMLITSQLLIVSLNYLSTLVILAMRVSGLPRYFFLLGGTATPESLLILNSC